MNRKNPTTKETDYLIIGAGAMGMAFADEIFTRQPNIKLTIIDRRAQAGGHWNDAYPFVGLHQPAAFYGVNSLILGNGSTDLSSKTEILAYYEEIVAKFKASGRVEFLTQHNYLGKGQVADLQNPENVTTYKINQRLVDATYMNVEVPSTHAPKYTVDEGVSVVPINNLVKEYDQWDKFYVIGNGKTGMDAVLYLLHKGVNANNINWIAPNDAWLFNREALQIGKVGNRILEHAVHFKNGKTVDEVFLAIEKTGGIIRIDEQVIPKKWRCGTVSPKEVRLLRKIKNVLRKGRVNRITPNEISLQNGTIPYIGKTLFVDCSANALSKRPPTAIFSKGKITLQSVLFCQQVFSAAVIARLALSNLSDEKRNQVIPVPHPEYKEDWPTALAVSIENLFKAHLYFPMWMFNARLNFMSHEPILQYFRYAIQFTYLKGIVTKAAKRINSLQTA